MAPKPKSPAKSKTPPAGSPVKALYRKYRPTSLADVVGQEQITTPLQAAIEQGKISHAYLFIGPRGTGKTSVARIFAHAVNGFDYQLEDSYLDIIEIDAASNTGVDNIRELREKAIIAPTQGKYKVYIIDEVHMLTKSAANALLKTLEEPPEHVIFIMATTDAYKVPITISSRTQVHTFRLADPETMFTHLRKIADLENIPIEDEALRILVRRGGGSFRDSLSILDQITTLSDQTITADLLWKALGLPQTQALSELLASYLAQDATKLHHLLKDLLNTGIKPETIASELIETILAEPNPALFPLLSQLPEVQPPFANVKLLLALMPASPAPQTPSQVTPVKPASTSPAPLAAPSESTPPQDPTPPPTPLKTPTNAPEQKPAPEKPQKPVTDQPQSTPTTFSWDQFLDLLRTDHDGILLQLQKTEHEYTDDALHIYPSNKFCERFLKRADNSRILADTLRNFETSLIIHSVADTAGAKDPAKDATISQISAIMGNVKEIDADMPF